MAGYANVPPPPSYDQVANNTQFVAPVQKIELKISCRNLIDMDVFSKSDPFVVIYLQAQNAGQWREIGRTETIQDCLNPDFVKSFTMDYFFEEHQMVKFEVYDSDSASYNLSDHDFIGKFVTSLGSIVGENGGKVEHPLQEFSAQDNERNVEFKRSSRGTIILRAEEVSSCKDFLKLQLYGKNLDKMDWFGKSDPYLEFQRCNEDNTFSVVHRTEVIKNTLNPSWQPISLHAQVLCNGDYDRTIKVVCYDWNSNGTPDYMGQFDLTLRDLKEYSPNSDTHFDIINIEKQKKKKSKYKNSGVIYIRHCEVIERSTFLDYIRGGMEMNFVVAIDFTASNGNPADPNSLHHSTQYMPSQYVQSLQAIGSIIEDYDSDKLFPCFGFGAKLPPAGAVSHEFALNFNPRDPNVQGINGIIAAYYHSITNVQLYGPTNFSPVINSTANIAHDAVRTSPPGSNYFVLLIITDGIISDMENTKKAIVNAATLPISIIIVGVGTADFGAMEELDGDEVRLSYQGRYAERDIVQFVPFRDYLSGNTYNPASGVRLAKDVLHEVPDQVVGYMEKNKIKANPPPPAY